MSERPYTVVEFKDRTDAGESPTIRPQRVFINGTEVQAESRSVSMDTGLDGGVSKVTLTLLPAEIHFHNKETS